MIRHLFSTDILKIDSDKYPIKKLLSIKNTDHRIATHFSALQHSMNNKKDLSNQYILEELRIAADDIFKHIQNYSVQEKTLSISLLIQPYIDETQKNDELEFISDYSPSSFQKIYIPLLRGLRTLTDGTDVFQQRTITDYFIHNDVDHNIFTGHGLYEDLKNSLLGAYEERERVREFEMYLSKNFFNNQPLSLVPRVNDNVVHFKEGNKPERPIYDLGDGLQAIIILTFKIFMATKPTMFFIEEPEQHLHASMQRSLIEAFSSHPEHMYFITTHSNHFIDLSQETDNVGIQRVYQRIDNNTETTVIESSSKDAHILADLGVRASSVLLANCSIWVEGITDKLYLRAYMNKFIEELNDTSRAEKLRNYKENLHYIFTEYQGSNITHWDFSESASNSENATPARSVTSKIMLIADEDIDGKGDRVSELTEALGEKFELLSVKEIENLIPELILQKTAEDKWKSKKYKEKYEASFSHEDIKQDAYSNEFGIGTYLETLINKNNSEYKFFADKSGTIKLKVDFCNTALSYMKNDGVDWKLTLVLTTLCEKIWSHIENSNYQ